MKKYEFMCCVTWGKPFTGIRGTRECRQSRVDGDKHQERFMSCKSEMEDLKMVERPFMYGLGVSKMEG